MAFPELQAFMDLHAAQMRDFLAVMMQQQQTAIEAMMNIERGRPTAQAQGSTRSTAREWRALLESRRGMTGRSNSSQRPRRPTQQYHLIETAEREEKEIDDLLSLTEEERSLGSGANPSRCCTRADSVDSRRGESSPRGTTHDANEGHATHDDSH